MPVELGERLRWVAFGFSALGLSDQGILKREFVVYGALYAECQRRVGGSEPRWVIINQACPAQANALANVGKSTIPPILV